MIRLYVKGIFALSALLAIACGGAPAPASSPAEEDVNAPPPAAAPVAAPEAEKDGDKEEGPVDEQAEQAAAFCSHAVEESQMQPPDLLNKKQITACLLGLRPAIKSDCSKGVQREIVMKIIVDKTGDVSGAFPIGDFADSPEATCIAEKVKGVKFPQFKGQGQQVIEKYPFKIEP